MFCTRHLTLTRGSSTQNYMQDVERDLVQIERSLERRVMGDDGYDSRSMEETRQRGVND